MKRSAFIYRPPHKPITVKRYHNRIARMGCLVCGGPATIHHVTSDGFKRISRSHWLVVPLCPGHHQIQFSQLSVEAMGHARFCEYWNIDLHAEAQRLADKHRGEQ